VLEGVFPEFRLSKRIDDISTRFRSDPLADRIQRRAGKSKTQIDVIKRKSLRDVKKRAAADERMDSGWVNVNTAIQAKAKKVRPVDKNDGTGGTLDGDWTGINVPSQEIPRKSTSPIQRTLVATKELRFHEGLD